MSVRFEDFSIDVKQAIAGMAEAVLEEVAGELESQVKQNTAVDTGQLKNSWTHTVGETDTGYTATVGSPLENAIWEEFGTGEYALNGDGRKGGWAYRHPRTGEVIWTRGKRPRRAFHKAYTTLKPKLIKYMQSKFKGGLS